MNKVAIYYTFNALPAVFIWLSVCIQSLAIYELLTIHNSFVYQQTIITLSCLIQGPNTTAHALQSYLLSSAHMNSYLNSCRCKLQVKLRTLWFLTTYFKLYSQQAVSFLWVCPYILVMHKQTLKKE